MFLLNAKYIKINVVDVQIDIKNKKKYLYL